MRPPNSDRLIPDGRGLRSIVLSDPVLQARLAAIVGPQAFVDRLAEEAAQRGLPFSAGEAEALLAPGPLGLERFGARPPDGSTWPSAAWLPVDANLLEPEPSIDWLYAGEARPDAPFYSDTVRQLLRRPFNRAFRYRMTIADFVRSAERGPAPDGLIFHMSRCGSTLVARMIMALTVSLVISEPPPLDDLLQIALHDGEDAAIAALRAMAAAFGRRGGRPFVIKLDAWHALALPLFRRAFPDTPWIFLHREPVEVLVSHVRQRGAQMLPQLFPPRFWGIDLDEAVPDADYCARVLGAICNAAADHAALGGGLMIDYRDLPGAVFSVVLPHFGLTVSAAERAAMEAVTERDVKAPHQEFTADGEVKRREASDAVRQAAASHLAAARRRLAATA
jgi:hypothetical protein